LLFDSLAAGVHGHSRVGEAQLQVLDVDCLVRTVFVCKNGLATVVESNMVTKVLKHRVNKVKAGIRTD